MGQLYVGGMHGDPDTPRKDMPVIDGSGTMIALEAATLLALTKGVGIEARTATVAGATSGTISETEKAIAFVDVTCTNAAYMIVLPAPTPGRIVILTVAANGYKLKTSAPGTVGLGGNTPSAAHVSTIPANSVAVLFCISAVSWVGFTITGQTHAAVPTAA